MGWPVHSQEMRWFPGKHTFFSAPSPELRRSLGCRLGAHGVPGGTGPSLLTSSSPGGRWAPLGRLSWQGPGGWWGQGKGHGRRQVRTVRLPGALPVGGDVQSP